MGASHFFTIYDKLFHLSSIFVSSILQNLHFTLAHLSPPPLFFRVLNSRENVLSYFFLLKHGKTNLYKIHGKIMHILLLTYKMKLNFTVYSKPPLFTTDKHRLTHCHSTSGSNRSQSDLHVTDDVRPLTVRLDKSLNVL